MKKTRILILLLTMTQAGFSQSVFKFNKDKMASAYYQNDSSWYKKNIPFFECSDKTIQDVYYYRWKLYKAHIRNVGGENGYVITEFIDDVDWDKKPNGTINAAVGHHILEGRWIKATCYLDCYINYMYKGGGNDRRYIENMAYAAYARYEVNADKTFVTDYIDDMKRIYDAWNGHYDTDKNFIT